ncbi:hypothetical protein C8Q74DRAFT_1300639 [Fomes fomentarius]|nr:hypothetical protein C8Q74DRAFT_1300639 [Fomes fomentarius]
MAALTGWEVLFLASIPPIGPFESQKCEECVPFIAVVNAVRHTHGCSNFTVAHIRHRILRPHVCDAIITYQ